ncbi:hypothetical protein N9K77_00785 [bacterium]|nr:hypothetical protein [bacterium]
MKDLYIYNSLSSKKEKFIPIEKVDVVIVDGKATLIGTWKLASDSMALATK